MTMLARVNESVGLFLERAISSEGPAAVRIALDLLDGGASTEEVVVDLLAAAQRESGDRWLRDEWTVADEHIVSGVTQRSLDAIANSVAPPAHSGSVVVACAEGDWHSLPAQMCAEVIRAHGFAVSFLGASTPSDHVARLLRRDHPDAVLVTCNLPLFFGGVTRIADAAHRCGTPVIAGGRALLAGSQRALLLGADAWAPDIAGALVKLGEWVADPPSPSAEPTDLNGVALQLDLDSSDLAAAAFASMMASYSGMGRLTADQQDRTREDLVFIVRFVAAARLVDDPTVLTEFLDWLGSLLEARGVPSTALIAGLEALVPLVAGADAGAGELTHAACGRVVDKNATQ